MLSDFARDLADADRPITEAAEERPGKPIRVRVQPMILRRGGQYNAWKDVRWTLDCETPEEAFAVREAMRLFFAALASAGPHAVITLLTPHQAMTRGKEKIA
jgi:hypothetical protein